MSHHIDTPNNFLADDRRERYRDPDLYVCSVCERDCHESELDHDAGGAFDNVCRECADAQRVQAIEEDAETTQAQSISDEFNVWWQAEGLAHFSDLQNGRLWADAAREAARLAWLAGAVRGVKAVEV
jgi:hypothetical protein